MSYTRPNYDAAAASWVGAATYTRPTYDAADASFAVGYVEPNGDEAHFTWAGAEAYTDPAGDGAHFDWRITGDVTIGAAIGVTINAWGTVRRTFGQATLGQISLAVVTKPPINLGQISLLAVESAPTRLGQINLAVVTFPRKDVTSPRICLINS